MIFDNEDSARKSIDMSSGQGGAES